MHFLWRSKNTCLHFYLEMKIHPKAISSNPVLFMMQSTSRMGLNLAQNLPNLQLSLRCMWGSNQSECLSRTPDDQIQTLRLVHIQQDKSDVVKVKKWRCESEKKWKWKSDVVSGAHSAGQTAFGGGRLCFWKSSRQFEKQIFWRIQSFCKQNGVRAALLTLKGFQYFHRKIQNGIARIGPVDSVAAGVGLLTHLGDGLGAVLHQKGHQHIILPILNQHCQGVQVEIWKATSTTWIWQKVRGTTSSPGTTGSQT